MDAIRYLVGEVELILALACLVSVVIIGKVGMSFLLVVLAVTLKNILDQQAVVFIYAMEGEPRQMIALWHTLFSFTEASAAIAVYFAHKFTLTNPSLFMRFFLASCFLKAGIHMVRAMDKLTVNDGLFSSIYSTGIPTINFLVLLMMVFGLWQVYVRRKKFGKRIQWWA